MPQLRSFSFGAGPSLPDAYKTGYDINQNQQQIDQRAQIARDEIANRYAIAQMETSARQQALQQQALQQAQELEVQKSIKQQQLGLQARELEQQTAFQNQQLQLTGRHYDTEAQKAGVITDEAARKYEAQQRMRMAVQEAISQGKSPQDALRESAAVYGTEAGAAGPMMGDIIQTATGGTKAALPRPVAMPLLDEQGNPTGETIYQSSQNQFSRVPKSAATDTEASFVPGSEGQLMKFNKKYFPNPKLGDVKDLTKERDSLKKQLEGDDFDLEKRMYGRSQNPDDKLTDSQKAMAKRYADSLLELQKMNQAIDSAKQGIRSSAQKAFMPPGLDTRASTNNAPKRIKYNPATRSFE